MSAQAARDWLQIAVDVSIDEIPANFALLSIAESLVTLAEQAEARR